jgi:hypothetical protein
VHFAVVGRWGSSREAFARGSTRQNLKPQRTQRNSAEDAKKRRCREIPRSTPRNADTKKFRRGRKESEIR